MRKFPLAQLALVGIASCFIAESHAALLLAYENQTLGAQAGTGTLWDVDSSSTAISNPRTTLGNLVDIEFGLSGTLYGLTSSTAASDPNSLFQINALTGTASLIGFTGLNNLFEGDLAFDATTGLLWGGYQLATPNANFFTLNTVTGAATLMFGLPVAFTDYSGIAFDGSGNLLLLNTQSGFTSLSMVNKFTGTVISTIGLTDSGNAASLTGSAGLDFDPTSNTMFVTDSGTKVLYSLDTTSGVLTFLRNGFSLLADQSAGLAVVPQVVAVSEPGSLSLLGLALAGVGLMARRRRLRGN
jgi:hypothetical protein